MWQFEDIAALREEREACPHILRSLSGQKKIPIDTETWYLRRYRIVFISTAPGMKLIARRGWVVSPTARSVTAKHWNNSFVWGRIEFTLRRAKRIRTLPRNVAREREKFRAARNTEKLDKTMIERRYSFRLRCCTSSNWLCQSMSRVNGTPFAIKKIESKEKT